MLSVPLRRLYADSTTYFCTLPFNVMIMSSHSYVSRCTPGHPFDRHKYVLQVILHQGQTPFSSQSLSDAPSKVPYTPFGHDLLYTLYAKEKRHPFSRSFLSNTLFSWVEDSSCCIHLR